MQRAAQALPALRSALAPPSSVTTLPRLSLEHAAARAQLSTCSQSRWRAGGGDMRLACGPGRLSVTMAWRLAGLQSILSSALLLNQALLAPVKPFSVGTAYDGEFIHRCALAPARAVSVCVCLCVCMFVGGCGRGCWGAALPVCVSVWHAGCLSLCVLCLVSCVFLCLCACSRRRAPSTGDAPVRVYVARGARGAGGGGHAMFHHLQHRAKGVTALSDQLRKDSIDSTAFFALYVLTAP
eukprot:2935977-Rhodomonas_salina.1